MPIEPFGKAFEFPSFPDPNSFRRNVVPGMIPSPALITERVICGDLKRGDVVLYLGMTLRHVDHVGESFVRFSPFGSPDSVELHFSTSLSMPIDRVTGVTFGSLQSVIPIEWLRDDTQKYYGKFSSQYEEYCWQSAMENRDYYGSCSEIGWVASPVAIKYRGDHHEVLPDGTERLIEFGRDEVLAQWRDEIGLPAGYIVHEDDCGRVDVEFFDSLSEFEAECERLAALESSLWEDEDLEENEDEMIEGCVRHGNPDCTDPECDPLGVMHSEARQNELWGGTE